MKTKIRFDLYTPQALRDEINFQIKKCGDPKQAAYNAIAILNQRYGVMQKAQITKYKRRWKGKDGKWQYEYYNQKENENIKTIDSIKLKMRFDAQSLLFNFNHIGFIERFEDKETNNKALQKANEFENKISKDNYEHTVIIDREGNIILEKTGTEEEVVFSDDEIKQIKKSEILTHSHPKDLSFSAEDVFLALSLGIKELRVKTPGNSYFFKISSKKESENKDELYKKNMTFITILNSINNSVTTDMWKKIKSKTMKTQNAEKEHRELVWNLIKNNTILNEIFNIEYGKAK